MNRFFLRLFAVCACSTIAQTLTASLSPTLVKAVRVVCSLCLLVTVGSLFAGLPRDFSAFSDVLPSSDESVFSEPSLDGIYEQTAMLLAERVKKDLFDETGINPADVRIQYTANETDGFLLCGIIAVMPEGDLPSDYRGTLARHYGCPFTIIPEDDSP